MLAGSAAGIAAAFNAPLAGIIFGIEEMSRSFEVRASGLVLGTVIAAGLTSLGAGRRLHLFRRHRGDAAGRAAMDRGAGRRASSAAWRAACSAAS